MSEYIASQIPGAQLYFFGGKEHMPLNSATEEFCRVLCNFVLTGHVEGGLPT